MPSFQELIERWMAGEALQGVEYELNDLVEVLAGTHAGERGTVIAPVEFEPEPVFVVELSTGTDVEVAQSLLRAVG